MCFYEPVILIMFKWICFPSYFYFSLIIIHSKVVWCDSSTEKKKKTQTEWHTKEEQEKWSPWIASNMPRSIYPTRITSNLFIFTAILFFFLFFSFQLFIANVLFSLQKSPSHLYVKYGNWSKNVKIHINIYDLQISIILCIVVCVKKAVVAMKCENL